MDAVYSSCTDLGFLLSPPFILVDRVHDYEIEEGVPMTGGSHNVYTLSPFITAGQLETEKSERERERKQRRGGLPAGGGEEKGEERRGELDPR